MIKKVQRDILCKEDCAVGCLKEVISMHSCSCHIGRQSIDQFTYLLQQYPIINPIDYKSIECVSIMIIKIKLKDGRYI